MTKWRHTTLLRAVLPFILSVLPAASQGLTGQISGTIRDSTGKPVLHAAVLLENSETGQRRQTLTNEEGQFVLAEVLPGAFTLTAEAVGFKRFQQDILLSASERLVLKAIDLEIGAVSEIVKVEAAAAQLQVESAERSGLVDSHQMQELSLKGRDYLATLKLLPGVYDANNATREAPGGSTLQGIFINGNRQGSLNLTLDGISTMDTGGGTGPYLQASIDAVAEVKVLTGNYQAEYGRSSGGTINTVTKSGTRAFHGGAYYYLRNEALNANDFFANRQHLPRSPYRFNYPGYFVGGPVLIPGTHFNRNRQKLFFFWSEEFLPRTVPTVVTFQTFPTALERQGDFSQTVDQNGRLIPIRDPSTNSPFPGNVVPSNRISPAGQALLKLFPQPNTVDPTHTYDYVFQAALQQPRNDQILRIDWNISPGTQFYARGVKDFQAIRGGFGFALGSPSWPQLPISYEIHGQGIVATLIHTFNPRTVNELTFGVNRGLQTVSPLNAAALSANQRTSLGVNLPQFFPQANPSNLVPNATFGGVPDAPQLNVDQRYPYFGANNVWQYSDNLSQVRGKHSAKLGIYIDQSRKNFQLASAFNGAFAFDRDANNPLDTGYAFSNAILGSVDSYTESTQHPVVHARDTNIEWYAQDAWRVTRRLTLDMGMRFYWINPTSSADTQLATFDASAYRAGEQPPLIRPYLDPATGARVGRDPITGQTLPAVKIGSFSTAAGTPNQGMQIYQTKLMTTPPIQLAPRFGVAWDVFGNGKTAIRGGFGIFYDRFPQNQVGQFLVEPPLVNTPTVNYTSIANLLSAPLSLSPNNVFGIQQNFKPPAVYNWSFGIQQSVGAGSVLDVAYVGDVARHGMQYRDLNATAYGTNFLASSLDPTLTGGRPLPPNFLRPFLGYGSIQYMEFASNSNYNALQVQLTRRLSTRLTFHLSYTWSKTLDVADTPLSAVNPVLDYGNRNYGPASFDRRQNLAINYVLALPSMSKFWSNRFSRQALDGWELSGILSFISGAPQPINYSFVTATDVTGASGVGIDSRVDLSCNPNLAAGDRSIYRGFDTTCVHPPTKAGLGIGNASKYPIVGPGVNNFDISLYKNFRFGESRRAQFRLETYNTFNHAQFTALDNNARFDASGNQVNQQLGQYTATAPARRVVLGLKIYF
jgi:hypothetical protein